MKAADLRAALECGKSSCDCHKPSSVTHCPAHDDASCSLSITDGRTAPLLKCFTGCSSTDIIAALKGRGLWDVEKVTPIRRGNEPTAVYRYTDADGVLVGEKGRFETVEGGKRTKTFRWRQTLDGAWDGLGGLGMEHVPLYNLHGVLAAPDKPVMVVEGEKAATALIERGIVAVCLPGGASQARFGNSLDVLRDRDVILWPDNDEVGRGLMARIAGLLPHAAFLSPVVPEKGDAYDYFEAGGTVEALEELLTDSAPYVRSISSDEVEVVMPQPTGAVTFGFSEMSWTSRATEARMAVDVRITGLPRVPFSTRINLGSSSGREGIRRELEQVYGKATLEWSRLLSTACSMADETWKGIDRSIDLASVEVKERQWFLHQRIPANVVSILFGMGGSMKSLIILDIALHAIFDASWMGMALNPIQCILVVDYEDTEDEWRLRAQQICQANGWEFTEGMIRFLPGEAIPIHEQAQRIRKIVTEHEVGLIIVDSASSATGGELLDTPSVSRTVNFLQSLGVTALMTAHNTKAEDSNYPYGSIMWSNLVRSTHYVETKQEEGSRTAYSTIHNRKANRGKQVPIGLRVDFPETDDGAVTIVRDNEAMMVTTLGQQTPLTRIVSFLTGGAKTYEEIGSALNIPYKSVQRIVTVEHPSAFYALPARKGGHKLIGLAADRAYGRDIDGFLG